MAKIKQLNEEEMSNSKKRFKKLLEYSFVNQEDDILLDEDKPEEDIPQQKADMNTNDPAVPTAPQGAADNGNMSKNADIPDNSGMPQDQKGGEESSEEIPNIDTDATPSSEGAPIDEPGEGIDGGEDEVEIDVTDLTDKQVELSSKIDAVTTQTQQMMDILSRLTDNVQSKIQSTSTEIEKLKNELIKRNPTPVETLQKRITVSDPFTETPADYWDKKERTSNYKLSDDEDKEYTIKPSDINTGNAREIYKSFDLDDDEMNQSLSSMFKF